MKPGDLIEWVYVANDQIVRPREELWSTPMQKWVPIGGVHVLVSIANGMLTWLPLCGVFKGLLHVRWDDTGDPGANGSAGPVAPRALG